MKAAAYYRMSSDRQETSIADQRTAVERFAKDRGYRIVAEYLDEGISGDDTGKRLGFQRMLSHAGAGDWKVILCWDQDRFGRFDPIEGGYWIKPLRDAGVRLETVAQGTIDWTDFAGRIVWTVQQEAKHAYLRDLSRNSLRGLIENAKQGRLRSRGAFGYIWQDGELVPSDDAPLVQRCFSDYLAGKSLREIADSLPARDVPWTRQGVREMFRNPVYCGDYVWGRRKVGRYHQAGNGEVTKAGGSGGQIIVEGHHAPLVSREQWDEVQRQLRQRQKRTSPRRTYLLSYLLRCGHCGGPLWGLVVLGEPRYRCQTPGCRVYTVREAWIAERVLAAIAERLGSAKATAGLLKRLDAMAVQKADTAPLQRRLAKLDKTLSEAARRLLAVDTSLLPLVEAEVKRIRAERDDVARQIDEERDRERMAGRTRAERRKLVMALASHVRECVAGASPERTRKLFQTAVQSVTVTWRTTQAGTASRHKVRKIHVRLGLDALLQGS